jgi:predicted ester cyclase
LHLVAGHDRFADLEVTSQAVTIDARETRDGGLEPLAALLRRYSFAYTAAHDFSVCSEIMVDDYVLFMGDIEVRDREGQYIPATAKLYRQFPGLGFTVHRFVLSETRAALHFSEHGHSTLFDNDSAWGGISLYEWDGSRLTECRVEQDYYSRRIQQKSGHADLIEAPAHDPWLTAPVPADAGTESAVREWLTGGGLLAAPVGCVDDEHCAAPKRMAFTEASTEVLDIFSAGPQAPFHALISGNYAGGLDGLDEHIGRPANLYVTGIATVRDGSVAEVRAITDRLAAERRMSAAAK